MSKLYTLGDHTLTEKQVEELKKITIPNEHYITIDDFVKGYNISWFNFINNKPKTHNGKNIKFTKRR